MDRDGRVLVRTGMAGPGEDRDRDGRVLVRTGMGGSWWGQG